MSNPFANLKTQGLEQAEDRLGGGFQARDSGAYDMKVKVAYAGTSDGGAHSVTIHLEDSKGEYRETVYITNKAGENYFLNKDDKTKKVPLPGFTVINDICLATTEAPLCDQVWEEKIVNIYDFDQKKEVPKAVMVCTSILGKEVTVGLLQTLKNKGVKQADNSYVDGPEERSEVNISKVFHTESRYTMAEAVAGAQSADFYPKWVEKNTGVVIDKRTVKSGAGGKAVGGPPQAGGAPAAGGAVAPGKSLFGKGK